jgi:hypothetical protein
MGEIDVGILGIWREARGAVLRKEYEHAMARMRDANSSAKSAFLNNVHQTIDHVIESYSSASNSERKAFLKEARKAALEMWNSGDWPSALGFGISCLNAESRFVPGEDASYVKRETDRILKEAKEAVAEGNAPRFTYAEIQEIISAYGNATATKLSIVSDVSELPYPKARIKKRSSSPWR